MKSLMFFETYKHLTDDVPIGCCPNAPVTTTPDDEPTRGLTTQGQQRKATSRQDFLALRVVANTFRRNSAIAGELPLYRHIGVDPAKVEWLTRAPRAEYEPTTRRKAA